MLNPTDTAMRSTNFEFIREYRPDLADEAATIESTFHHSVASAIDLLRTFGQRLAQHFIQAKGKSICDSNRRTYGLDDLLQTYAAHFPEPQRRLFDELRKEGNLQHEPKYQPTLREERQLRVAWELACWVGKQLGWKSIPIQFNPPPKGGHEFDEMRHQRNEALKRIAEAERSCDVSGWILRPEQQDLSAPPNFVGREFAFDAIKTFLANSECRVLVIQGQPGRGKTAIIKKFVSDGIPAGITPFVFCFMDQSSQSEPKLWVQHLYASLVQRWQLTPPDRSIKEANLEELVQQLRNRIAEVAEKHCDARLLFVIDGVDEAGPAEKKVVSFLQSKFPKTVQVIATARPNHVSLSSRSTDGQPEIQILDLDDPDLWNKHQADGRRYVNETMPGLPADAIKKVVQLSDGNFLFLLLICRELREIPKVTIANNLQELDLLKGGNSDFANELFKRSWQRLERLDADELDTVEKVATLLANAANARVPLSERIIRDTLRLRRADWVKVQQHFGEYLEESQRLPPFTKAKIDATGSRESEEESEGIPVFSLFHQTFKVFVRQHLKEDLAESNSQLVDYCREQLKKPKPSYEYAYALLFLPVHLMRAAEQDEQRWNELEELLTDIFFLEAKAKAGFVSELAADLLSAWQTMPSDRPMRSILMLLGEVIRRETHFIAEHAVDYPQGLFQCVWNLAWWYGNPEAEPYDEQEDEAASQKRKKAKVPNPEPSRHRETNIALVLLLERWRMAKESVEPGFRWLRSRRPPAKPLGGVQVAVIPAKRGGGEWVDCTVDGKLIAGGTAASLRIWNADTLVEIARMPEWEGQQFTLQAAAVSPNGNILIAACGEYIDRYFYRGCEMANPKYRPLLAVWDINNGRVRLIAHPHNHFISDIVFSPDGTRFATASWDSTIRIWDAEKFEVALVLDGCEGRVESVCFSPDGRSIVAGADTIGIEDMRMRDGQHTISIWDTRDGQQIRVFNFTGGLFGFCHVCFSPDGKRIATDFGGYAVSILDAESGNELVETQKHNEWVTCVCFSADGKRLVSGDGVGELIVSDASTGAILGWLPGHEGEVTSVTFLLDGKQIASGSSSDDTIRIWEVDSNAETAILEGRAAEEIEEITFLDTGERILSVSADQLCIWDGQSGMTLKEFESVASSRLFSKNGRRCVQFCPSFGESPASLKVWESRTGKIALNLQCENRKSCNFDLSLDGKKIGFTETMSEKEHFVRVFDVASGRELAKLKGHEDEINHLCFSANGAQIATASNDHTVRIWDASTGELLTRLHHEAAVRQVWFSPDGTQIVTFGNEDGVRVFDSDGGIEYFALDQNKQSIKDLCFSPDGTRIVADASGSIFIWKAKTGELFPEIAGSGDIRAIAADVEGKSLRLLDRGGETIVETASGDIVARYPGWLSHIATHPDGRTWAGAISNYLALIHLEGADHS